MKPVLILQHLSADGPAYLGTWLKSAQIAFEVRNTQAGDEFPSQLAPYAALAVLGGEMSANDELPSLRRAESLIRQGFRDGVPVIGHCLGGQLMARALGARVAASPAPEIGWQGIDVLADEAARVWFGAAGPRTVFQWHYEAFELPAGARRLAASAACPNQAFAIGPHLALQFHVELDAEKLSRWTSDEGARHLDALSHHATVQQAQAMRDGLEAHLDAHQALADRIYRRWLAAARG